MKKITVIFILALSSISALADMTSLQKGFYSDLVAARQGLENAWLSEYENVNIALGELNRAHVRYRSTTKDATNDIVAKMLRAADRSGLNSTEMANEAMLAYYRENGKPVNTRECFSSKPYQVR